MTSRLRASLLLAVIASLVGIGTLPAAADATVTMADGFASQSFSGNDGEVAFSGPWTEFGESNGPDAGPVYVWADPHCAVGSGWCLKIGGDGVNIDGHGVAREADTSDAGSAKLRYSFRRSRFDDYQSGAWVKVQVSGDGGDSWTTLARHKFNRDDATDVSKAARHHGLHRSPHPDSSHRRSCRGGPRLHLPRQLRDRADGGRRRGNDDHHDHHHSSHDDNEHEQHHDHAVHPDEHEQHDDHHP